MVTIEIVRDVLIENLGLDEAVITEEATLESLGVDSLDMVELVCSLEEKCGVEFGEEAPVQTIGEMVAYIDSLS